jgi:CheY-like chemotaxis protein
MIIQENKHRALVVDDNLDAAISLAYLLRAEGYRVETAFNGQMAFEIAGRFKPDVCLVDINMPGMSGYELATRIRKGATGRNNPILAAVTGYSDFAHLDRAAAAGFDLHFTKGEDAADIIDQIEASIAQKHRNNTDAPAFAKRKAW